MVNVFLLSVCDEQFWALADGRLLVLEESIPRPLESSGIPHGLRYLDALRLLLILERIVFEVESVCDALHLAIF